MSDQPAPTGPRVKRREAWVDLPEAYAGLKFRMWVNAPQKLWVDVWSRDGTRAEAALSQIILEHNGWLDFDGQPYPQLPDPQFWIDVPTELVSVMIIVAQDEIGRLPNSLAPKRRSFGRG